LGGVLVKQHAMLPIECLPADLVNHVAVPVGSLKTFDDAIRVRDLALPPGVVTHLPGDEIIASVAEPRSERELSELSSEVAAGEGPEVLTEKKEEAPEAAGGGAESEAKKGKA
ncbi:MAG: hypothetical protein HYW81_02595, partial [Parcubacteria group bacterium]|nr:hypothetical protein [Parcubacteria group bacterium]